MQVITIDQKTSEWLEMRKGKITGTRAKSVLAKNNTPLLDEMLAELLCTIDDPKFTSGHMERGNELEDEAISQYEAQNGCLVSKIGFCVSDYHKGLALSPDGLVELKKGIYEGGVEVKCPSNKIHAGYLRTQKLPAEYKYQVFHYFVVCETLKWVDFTSYNPNFSQGELVVVRVNREDYTDEIEALQSAEIKFLEKLQKEYVKII